MTQDGKIKFGTIVPLIGGMTVSNKMATGEDPAFLLSYPAFGGNDAHCVNHFKDSTPYLIADPATGELPESEPGIFDDVDFVSAVCPCAGLSMLNNSKSRGSDAAANDWMYKSAQLVLEKIKPRVFWGENAPGLYGNIGTGVVTKFQEFAKQYGYSLSLIKTDTYLHGIPQHRHRSFYFFWRDTEAPILNYYKRETPDLLEYLDQIPQGSSLMEHGFGLGDLDKTPWFQFLKHMEIPITRVQNSSQKSILDFCHDEGIMTEFITWFRENGHESLAKVGERVVRKSAEGKGWWDGSPLAPLGHINALISKNSGIVHPRGERALSVREAMWLMGLPHNFELVDYNPKIHNHICQNVPTSTAKDWTMEVIRYLKGEITQWGGSFVKQSNLGQRIDVNSKTATVLF